LAPRGLRHLLDDDFAVALLDVQMPGLDGFELAELIKGRDRTRNVPIIFLSAHSREESHFLQGYAAGAVDYLVKPIDPGVLRSKVAVFVALAAENEKAAHLAVASRAVLDTTTEGITLSDKDGNVIVSNPAVERMRREVFDLPDGLGVRELTGLLAERTTDPAAYRAHVEPMFDDPQVEGEYEFELAASARIFRRYTCPARRADGRLIGRIIVVREVTKER